MNGADGKLKTRHPARQAYHALDLARSAKYIGIDVKPQPRYYPQAPGGIELAAQAIIRLQQRFGEGSKQALDFSYAVQRCIWVTEEGDYCDVDVLKKLAKAVDIDEDSIASCVVDRRGDSNDDGVQLWSRYHQEAEDLGMFGTPNYVINGEIFWGQDRLWMVERRVQELVEAGAKPI